MSNAYIIGLGITRFDRYPDRAVESVAAEAIQMTLADAGIGCGEADPRQVENARVGRASNTGQAAPHDTA